jgi:hypothetical protein
MPGPTFILKDTVLYSKDLGRHPAPWLRLVKVGASMGTRLTHKGYETR